MTERPPSPSTEAARSKALVVDDEATGRAILKAQLEREGYRVVTAGNGRDALEAFEQEQPDIVFLDVLLPDLYGYQVARSIKQSAGERFVPIIFLTGLSEEEALAECVEAGGDDFLSKPLRFSILRSKMAAIERIRDLYERARAQKAELGLLHQRMQYEQDIAKSIFSTVVMARNVAVPPIQTWLQSASTFNGDIFLSAYTPAGGLSVLMGDFTGHGLAAAMGALPTAEIFQAMTAKGFAQDEVLAEINQKINSMLPTGMFLAAVALRIEPDLKTAVVWNSGMPDLTICRPDGSRRQIRSMHPPLGALPDFLPGCEPAFLTLDAGDVFVMCSDGVTEACNTVGEPFGEERFRLLLDTLSPGEVFDGVRDALQAFVGDAAQQDDISLVVIPCCAQLLASAGDEAEDGTEAPSPHPWCWDLRLEGANLARIDPVPLVINHLKALGVGDRHRQQLYVVVTEMFSNALEHGVLGLDSGLKTTAAGFLEYYTRRVDALESLEAGWVALHMDYRVEDGHSVLRVQMEDSGAGFALPGGGELQAGESAGHTPQISLAHSGRGFTLLRSLCRTVRHAVTGSRVEVEYLL